MSKLRGDDALFSVLDEMSSRQGYGSSTSGTTTAAVNKASTRQSDGVSTRQRLRPEIPGYPSLTKQAGSDAIWNPYVSSDPTCTLPPPPLLLFAPTNPWVEVFRRRAFERFKTKLQSTWEGMVAMMDQNSNTQMWKQVSLHTVLERWHFAIKLDEYRRVKQENVVSKPEASIPIICSTTSEIQLRLLKGRDKGTLLLDPILVASTTKSGSSNSHKQRRRRENDDNDTNEHRTSLQLLSQEMKMEWTRAWQKSQPNDKEELENILQSHKFRRVVSKLHRAIQDLAQEAEGAFWSDLSKRSATEEMQQGSSHKQKNHIPKIRFDTGENGNMVSVTHCGLTFSLHHEHYEKLQVLFDRFHTKHPQQEHCNYRNSFASALFCVLCRYDMLEGAGLQSSLHGGVFDVLLKHFQCRMECFASPFNCRYEHYCSAYPDTDAVFGSVGSFFDYNFAIGGSFQANPPFVADLILRMHDTMSNALSATSKPLQFIVFVPAWTDTEGYMALESSKHLTRHVLLKQRHYYCEGTQQRRKERFRVASFDTSVFFLQNQVAQEKWPITDEAVNELRLAFETDPRSAIRHNDKVEQSIPPVKQAAASKHSKERETSGRSSRAVTVSTNSHGTGKKQRKHHVKPKDAVKSKKRKTVDSPEQQLSILTSLGILDDSPAAAESETSDNKPVSGKQLKEKSKSKHKKHKKSIW